jgi:hypothetical protein
MLPVNTILGELEIFEVYEYLDGPRLFAARNNIGTKYLAFWFDEEDDATGWLYLPLSEEKLNKLRRKKISLHSAYLEPETNYFLVYTASPPRKDSVEIATPDNISSDFFPPEGYYIEYVDVIDEKADDWAFEAILKGGKPSAKVLAEFIGRFRELIEDIMNFVADRSSKKKPLQLYPQSALPGSIKMKFSADSSKDAIEALKVVSQLIQADKEGLQHQLKSQKINTSQLKDFLAAILRNKLAVEIVPKLASYGEVIEFPIERVKQCIEYLNDITYLTVDSIKIPQANDIDKVLEIVTMIDNGTPLTSENFGGIAARQVKYYSDAAYAFGLITKDKQLTSAGHFINSRINKDTKYEILADRFESTDFGRRPGCRATRSS